MLSNWYQTLSFAKYDFAKFCCYILAVAAVFPYELYLGPVFIRPLLLATLILSMCMFSIASTNINHSRGATPNINYIFAMSALAIFFPLQGMTIGSVFVGIKEFIEITISLLLMLVLVNLRSKLGTFKILEILRNVSFLVAVTWAVFNVVTGNYITFKDPYWILLLATLLSLVFVKYRRNRIDMVMLLTLIPLDVLSASRTLWVVVIVTSVMMFGVRKLLLPSFIVVLLLVLSSNFDRQYGHYYSGMIFIASNFLDIIADPSILNGHVGNVSDRVRISEMLRTARIFLDHPILGVGVEQYNEAVSRLYGIDTYLTAHNEFMRILAEGGGVLFFIYSVLYFSIWRALKRCDDKCAVEIGHVFIVASMLLAFFTATNYMIHFILQLAVLFLPGISKRFFRS